MNFSCTLGGCPGKYCGRLLNDDRVCQSPCTACPLGHQITTLDNICTPCNSDAELRDYMFFVFMVLLTLSGHLVILAVKAIKGIKTQLSIAITASSCVLECIIAAILTLLLFEPYGDVVIKSCGAKEVSDFYPIFYNPIPDFVHEVNCVSEIVHPLYSFVFVFLGFSLLFLVLFRGVAGYLIRCYFKRKLINRVSIFYSLIWIPFVVLFHAIFAGLIYFSFDYLSLIAGTLVFAIVSVVAQKETEEISYNQDRIKFKFAFKLWKDPLYVSFGVMSTLFTMTGILSLTDEIDSNTLRLQLLPLAIIPFVTFPLLSTFANPDHYLTAWGSRPSNYNGPLS